MAIHSTNATRADYRAYTDAFKDGGTAALLGLAREAANAHAGLMPVRAGDAFLAGYYAELRRLRNYQDLER